MASKPYLIFDLGDSQYGIDASLVKEIFPLPELTPVPEAPTDIIGILNLRGEVLPVMHLGLRLGRSAIACKLSDQIVVLDWQGLQVGMVVEHVQELQTIDEITIQVRPDYGRANNINPAFIAGIAKLDDELVVLLDPETLIRQPEQVATMVWDAQMLQAETELDAIAGQDAGKAESTESNFEQLFKDDLQDDLDDLVETAFNVSAFSVTKPPEANADQFRGFYDRYCLHATESERGVFRQRAENLRQSLVSLTDSTGLSPLAVVNLGGEFFGLNLTAVREFTSVRNLTTIPCCPSHIIGNMNLRGEIVTLVDIRSLLNLPTSPVHVGSQTVVVQVDDVIAGLPVDDVSDVLYVDPKDIKPVPIAVQRNGEAYLQGMVPAFDRTLGILDLHKIMTRGGLEVNDE
jgi:purine-binding chemotaxis protein CheW